MNKAYLRLIPLVLGGIFVFTGCDDPLVRVENVVDPADPVVNVDVDSLTGIGGGGVLTRYHLLTFFPI